MPHEDMEKLKSMLGATATTAMNDGATPAESNGFDAGPIVADELPDQDSIH